MTKQIETLKTAQTDNAKFDALVETLRTDRKLHTAEIRKIAEGFLGYPLKASKGRTAALKAIADHQRINARQTARGQVLSRSLNAW